MSRSLVVGVAPNEGPTSGQHLLRMGLRLRVEASAHVTAESSPTCAGALSVPMPAWGSHMNRGPAHGCAMTMCSGADVLHALTSVGGRVCCGIACLFDCLFCWSVCLLVGRFVCSFVFVCVRLCWGCRTRPRMRFLNSKNAQTMRHATNSEQLAWPEMDITDTRHPSNTEASSRPRCFAAPRAKQNGSAKAHDPTIRRWQGKLAQPRTMSPVVAMRVAVCIVCTLTLCTGHTAVGSDVLPRRVPAK